MVDEIQIGGGGALTSGLPPGLSILVPVYNSSEILPNLIESNHTRCQIAQCSLRSDPGE